jgi:hypothetical protein
MVLDERSTALNPIAVIHVPDWTYESLLSSMHVSADKAVGPGAAHDLKDSSIIDVGQILNYFLHPMAKVSRRWTSLDAAACPFTRVPLVNAKCHRVELTALDPAPWTYSAIELMSVCYQHSTAICSMMNQFSSTGCQSQQALDQVETGLVMIARQELDTRPAPTPGTDLIGHSLLRIVEVPRPAYIPTVDYIAN